MTKQYEIAKQYQLTLDELGYYWIDSPRGEEKGYEVFQNVPLSYNDTSPLNEDNWVDNWFEINIWHEEVEFVLCNHNENNWKGTDYQVLFTSDSIDEVLSIIKSNEEDLK